MNGLISNIISSIPGLESHDCDPPSTSDQGDIDLIDHDIKYHEQAMESPTEDIEQAFADWNHEFRLVFIAKQCISPSKWREFRLYIEDDHELEKKWGQAGSPEQNGNCKEHEVSLTKKVIFEDAEHTLSNIDVTREELRGDITGGIPPLEGQVGSSVESETGSQESNTNIKGSRKIILECESGLKDCTINRRTFINAGDFWMSSSLSRNTLYESFTDRLEAVNEDGSC